MDTPVLLLTVDALRYDRFTESTFPKCQADFADFAKWNTAYSHGVATPFSFPGIIAGELAHGEGELPPSASTLAERLSSYSSAGFGNNPHLIADRGYHRGFDQYHHASPPDDVGSEVWIDRLKRFARSLPMSDRLHDFVTWLQTTQSNETIASPSYADAGTVKNFVKRQAIDSNTKFVWGHFMDPHFPFDPDGIIGEDTPVTDGGRITETVEAYLDNRDGVDLNLIAELYETNIRYLDHHLHELFSTLRDYGIYDDALIIVTADHGELLGEHGRTAHPWDSDPHDELVQIPLMVKYPDGRHAGVQFDHVVQHADIGATIDRVINRIENPDSGIPLTEPTERLPVSLSNTAIRISSSTGSVIRRRSDDLLRSGTVTDRMEQRAMNTAFPTIPHLSGEVSGVERQELKQRLENLGYR